MICVPPPGTALTSKCPPTACARSLIVIIPRLGLDIASELRAGSKPMPLSDTDRMHSPPECWSWSSIRVARACLVTLLSASWAIRNSVISISRVSRHGTWRPAQAAHRGSGSPRCASPWTPRSPPPKRRFGPRTQPVSISLRALHIALPGRPRRQSRNSFSPAHISAHPVTFLSAERCSGEYNGDRG